MGVLHCLGTPCFLLVALDKARRLFVFCEARQCEATGVAQEAGQLFLVLHVREKISLVN